MPEVAFTLSLFRVVIGNHAFCLSFGVYKLRSRCLCASKRLEGGDFSTLVPLCCGLSSACFRPSLCTRRRAIWTCRGTGLARENNSGPASSEWLAGHLSEFAGFVENVLSLLLFLRCGILACCSGSLLPDLRNSHCVQVRFTRSLEARASRSQLSATSSAQRGHADRRRRLRSLSQLLPSAR